MALFTDDFERANGAIGGNWYNPSSHFTISGGYVSSATTHGTYNTTVSDNEFLSATAHVLVGAHAERAAGPAVKFSASSFNCYYAFITYSSPTWTFGLYYYNGTSSTLLDSEALSAAPPPYCEIYIEWNLGALTATLNGAHTLTATHNTLAGGVYAGFYQYFDVSKTADVVLVGSSAASLTADPNVIGNYGDCTEIELTGANTAWTSGTPGSPTFTVNHGTISAQTVNSATSATITYCPGDYLGDVTITDPSTGLTVGIVVTSDPLVVPPGQACLLDESGADLINDTGANYPDYDILTQGQVIVPAADQFPAINVVQALSDVWYIITGGGGRTPPEGNDWLLAQMLIALMGDDTPTVQLYTASRATSIREELEALTDNLNDTRTVNDWTLGSVINEIRGTSNRTVTEVYDLVDALTGGDNSDVLLWLDTYLGTTGPTLAQLGTMISDLATIAGYDLSDVLDAIAAIPATDLSAITTKLNEIQPNASYTLSTIAGQLDGVGSSLGTINDKLDALADAVALLPTSADLALTPPVWPGVANVTLGTAEALTDGLTLTGPMHGIIVNITGNPAGAGKYMFGSEVSWTHVGAVAFVNDRGDYERPDALGLEDHVITPKTMAAASSAVLRVNSGFTGTARTWIKTA